MSYEIVYLSRRNLMTLLAKLDANKDEPGSSMCSIIKHQNPRLDVPFRQSVESLVVVSIDDEAFYSSQYRSAGFMKHADHLPAPSTGVEPNPYEGNDDEKVH